MNRPEARNALSAALRSALTDAFRSVAADDSIGCVVLTGEGKAFCAGNDLKEHGSGERGDNVADTAGDMSTELIPAIEACPVPIIAAVNGYAVTAGFELVLACDIIIASSAASFADSHVRVGVLPGWGLSQRLPRLIGFYRASELAYSGNFITAEQAAEWGLANRVVAPDALLSESHKLASDILSANPAAVRAYKRLLIEGYDRPFGEAMQLESERAIAFASGVSAGDVEARREGVRDRGRAQSKER